MKGTSSRIRALSAVGLLGAMLAMTSPSAYAAGPEQYRGSATGTGVTLNVLGQSVLGAGNSSALGRALATAILARGGATGLNGAPGSPSTAERSGIGSTRVPAAGESCATPNLAAAGVPAPIVNALQVGAACSYASAQIASRDASGHGQSTVADVNVSAELLAKVITDLIIPTLRTALGPVVSATGTVGMGLTTAKATVCPPITIASATLGAVCSAAITDIANVPIPTIDALITAIQAAITNALRGVNLLTIGLGGSTSDVTTTATAVAAAATGSTLSVTSPNLKFLIQAINAAIAAVLNSFLDAVAAAVANSTTAKAVAALLPAGTLDQVVAAVKNQVRPAVLAAVKTLEDAVLAALPFLNSDVPLIRLQGANTTASATVTRATGTVARAASAGVVVVDLNPLLATFLSVPAHTSVAPGVDMTLFSGTPLESRVAVGAATMTKETLDGIPVQGAKAEGLTLELLRTVMGGVVLNVSGASASAGDIPAIFDSPSQPSKPGLPLTAHPPNSARLPLAALLLALAVSTAYRSLRRRPRGAQTSVE